jgi:hypothetical protein
MTDLSQSMPPGTPTGQESDETLTNKAADTADAAKRAAGDVTQTATERVKDVAGEAQRQARDLVGEVRGQLDSQLGTQHHNLVNNLQRLAEELRGMAGAAEQDGLASELVGEAGDRARGAADWIGSRQPGDLLDEVRSFARRRPGTFLVGALVAGVAVGRLTRGVVAVHNDDSEDSTATQTIPSANAADSSLPPAQQGIPDGEGISPYGRTASSNIRPPTLPPPTLPPPTFPPPASPPPPPTGPGPMPS